MADSGTENSTDVALAACCSLLHVFVDELGRADQPDPARRRLVAAHALEKFPLPAAIFGGIAGDSPLANGAWRLLFGEPLPPVVEAALEHPADVARQLTDFELRRPDYVGYFSIELRPLRVAPGTLAVAAETTDRVIAKQVDISPTTLVWFRDDTSETGHYNELWTRNVAAPWPESIHQADLPRWTSALADVLRGEDAPELEVRLRMADGVLRWHRVRVRRAGSRVVCSAVDIHALRRREIERTALLAQARSARADADAANRIKDEFLAAVSHELRAPLTTMLLWERVLRENGTDEASRVKALDAIHQSAVAQARLVADLLDFARGISGKLFLDIRFVELANVAQEAVDAARPLAVAKSVDLAFTATPFVGEVHADATRLRQVLDNLLSNAIKFTPAGGKVVVEVTRHGRFVTLSVTDSGRGIAPELLSRIFEPFSQGDDALARREGGLGLGLTISKQLVELHRGTLVAASDGAGKGATLTLSLPAAGTPRAPSPPVGMRRTPKLDGARVLVIDDDDHVRTALTVLLGRVGAIVDTAESAAMGHARMVAAEPHVLICDIGMPDEDGYCFVRSLRAAGCKIPSIALTAYATHSDAQRALEAGFDVHLAKPISVERLVETLSELLANRRLST
jgi:signal transduction histidine kinase/CheY-like chemotaxis protein